MLLSLDQSSRTTGYAIFDDNGLLQTYGLIKLNPEDRLDKRLVDLRDKVASLIERYNIDSIVMEDIQYQQNPVVYRVLAQVLGVLCVYLYERNISYKIVSSSEWRSKLRFTSRRRDAQKLEAQQLVNSTFGINATQDESDAICIGLSQNLQNYFF